MVLVGSHRSNRRKIRHNHRPRRYSWTISIGLSMICLVCRINRTQSFQQLHVRIIVRQQRCCAEGARATATRRGRALLHQRSLLTPAAWNNNRASNTATAVSTTKFTLDESSLVPGGGGEGWLGQHRLSEFQNTLFIGTRVALQQAFSVSPATATTDADSSRSSLLHPETVAAMIESCSEGGTVTTFCRPQEQEEQPLFSTNEATASSRMIHIGIVPSRISRNNHPWSVNTVTDMVSSKLGGQKADGERCSSKNRLVFVMMEDNSNTTNNTTARETNTADYSQNVDGMPQQHHRVMGALILAAAKAFPVYTRKTVVRNGGRENQQQQQGETHDRTVHISFWNAGAGTILPVLSKQQRILLGTAVCEGVQLAQRLVDMPPNELTTTVYAEECQRIATELGETVTYSEIAGDKLRDRGYGGLYGVGKAATTPPRLVILEYTPPEEGDTTSSTTTTTTRTTIKSVALVGKGITYDTGTYG
jgi:Cytosol aminopeptidase family, catalytic domain